MFRQSTTQFCETHIVGGREGGKVRGTLTDEPRMPQNPQQLVVDVGPTAHPGLAACWNMPVETCDSSDHDQFTARRRQMPKLHGRHSDGATEALNLIRGDKK